MHESGCWARAGWELIAACISFAAALMPGCSPSGSDLSVSGGVTLNAWAHAGQESERTMLKKQLDEFDALKTGIQVRLTFIPEGSYQGSIFSIGTDFNRRTDY
jgi:ABC-type glycerol-3-phosphate transport system substrate-binding protein